MTAGARAAGGTLLPSHFLEHGLQRAFSGRLGERTRAAAFTRFRRWWQRCDASVGPATPVRALAETSAASLFSLLGFDLTMVDVNRTRVRAIARSRTPRAPALPVLIARWGDDLDRCWRDAVVEGLTAGASWSYCWNVRVLRIVDAARPWGRRHVAFDLAACAADVEAFAVLWGVARADATRGSLLDELQAAAARATASVCTGLERGVTDAVARLAEGLALTASKRDDGRARPAASDLFDQALTVVYRLLFLLFAEARALVPMWHPVYRDGYSVAALRDALEHEPAAAGLWQALQAMTRLARAGCSLGALRVTPFNGHLFSSGRAPLAERASLADDVMRRVLSAVTTTVAGGRQVRIAFGDLGVEQLGAIYERVLDHRLVIDPDAAPPGPTIAGETTRRVRQRLRVPTARLVADRGDRKASATFYTPRALTDLIVRRTLAPLVGGVPSAQILRLRVLDPSMGSGAFLVAACRYLARAYEAALTRERQLADHEIDDRDRAGFRRLIARRCLYGVDSNPMAVQLARLSLWLATLASDVPLTFLDHHLRVGNSLVGAALGDLLRQAPGRPRGRAARRGDDLPLLAATEALEAVETTIPERLQLEDVADDSLAQIRFKERLLSTLDASRAPLGRWKAAADLWCASWFWRETGPRPAGRLYGDLLSATLGRGSMLPASATERVLAGVQATAARERFFHWTLEFPEVFHGAQADSAAPGFDAVLGNPPWHMVRRTDDPEGRAPDGGARELSAFVRDSGIYAGAADAHLNLYLLFLERALQLTRQGGRVGMVVPWGLASDHGAANVRRRLLDGCAVDTFMALDNRRGLFPVHRSLRFLVVTATPGRSASVLPMHRVPGDAAALDAWGERAPVSRDRPVHVTRDLLTLVSGDTLAVPDLRSEHELRLLERLWRAAPALADEHGWAVRFGRELNASDDRAVFRAAPPGLPVVEGKHVEPFRASAEGVARFVDEHDARQRLPRAPFARPRLAYRDVAASTNERTLIAAIVPAGTVTTHTLFCCRTELDAGQRQALCALLNSVVANWMVRRWVSTHVTVALVERLPVPSPRALGPWAPRLAELAETLSRPLSAAVRTATEARLHALAAVAWGLTREDMDVVLGDFPLLPPDLVAAIRVAFVSLAPTGRG